MFTHIIICERAQNPPHEMNSISFFLRAALFFFRKFVCLIDVLARSDLWLRLSLVAICSDVFDDGGCWFFDDAERRNMHDDTEVIKEARSNTRDA